MLTTLRSVGLIALLLCCSVAACGSDTTGRVRGGAEAGVATGEHDLSFVEPDLVLSRNRDLACAQVSAMATLRKRPVDIVFIIDNSNSMTDKIVAVQNNINRNFAQIIGQSGLDWRVVMLSAHGDVKKDQYICIERPLSGTPSCSPPPPTPTNTATFFHYDGTISSNNELRQLLATFNKPDKHGFAPGGLSDFLRADSFKEIIVITDDDSDLGWQQFEAELFQLVPARFGTQNAREYRLHGIIGVKENSPATKPYGPLDPIVGKKCQVPFFGIPIDVPGTGADYQQLAMLTGGLRFPICQFASFDAVFKAVATGVIQGAKVACDFDVPMGPNGAKVDLDSVLVSYQSGGGMSTDFTRVADEAMCVAGGYFLKGARVFLCPATCATVQKDDKAQLRVLFDCDPNIQ